MCFNCEHSNRIGVSYFIEYRCKLCGNQISEVVNIYFNKRKEIIECPLLNKN